MKTTQNIKTILLGLIIAAGASYAGAAWTPAPSAGPTSGNVDAPLNVGSNLQTKLGSLLLGGLGVGGDFTYLPTGVSSVTPGQVLVAANASGKVAWGSASSPVYGYEMRCVTDGMNDGHGHTYYTPYCFKLNKTTGVLTTSKYNYLSLGQGSAWITLSNIPITAFGTAPYSLDVGNGAGFQGITSNEETHVCVISSSGQSKCVVGSVQSQSWQTITDNP